MGLRKVWNKLVAAVTRNHKPREKRLEGVDYSDSGVFALQLVNPPIRIHEVEVVDFEALKVMNCPPTIGLVRGDHANVVSLEENDFSPEVLLAEPDKITVGRLADALTIKGLEQLAARPRVDLVETTLSRPVSFMGDSHGHTFRAEFIFRLVAQGLKDETEELCSLGDLGHAENEKNIFRVYQSLQLTKAFMVLSLLCPDVVRLCVGNHDIFCPSKDHFEVVMKFITSNEAGTIEQLARYLLAEGFLNKESEPRPMMSTKKNVPQSYLMLHYLCLALLEQGLSPETAWDIIQLLQGFYDTSPMALLAKSPDGNVKLLAAHSCPIGVTSLEQLRIVRSPGQEKIYDSMIFSRPGDKSGDDIFTGEEVAQFMEAIGINQLLIGHTWPPEGWTDEPFPGVTIIHNNRTGFGRYRVFPNEDGVWVGQAEQLSMPMDKPELIFSH